MTSTNGDSISARIIINLESSMWSRKETPSESYSIHFWLYRIMCCCYLLEYLCLQVGQIPGWREVLRKVTPHEKASMTLQDGDTLIGVVEMNKGTYFFLGTNTKKSSHSE